MLSINKSAKSVYTILPSNYTVRSFVKDCYNVYEVLLGTEVQPFIIKTYATKQHAEAEVQNLFKLFDTNGVSKLLDYSVEGDSFWWTIISRIPGTDLLVYCQKKGLFYEGNIKPVIRNLCNILLKLEEMKIIYSDLKPENVMYDSNTRTVYIIDFESNDKKTNSYHTPEYIKAEIIDEKTAPWQLGVMIYYLLSGKFPFRDRKQVCDCEPIMSVMWSDDLQEFLGCLLDKNKRTRYSIAEAVNHSWLSE